MAINVKWGIYAGGAALLLAFLTSLIVGHAGFAVSVLRALCFAALFFILGTGIWTLINTFIPELLFPDANDDAAVNVFGGEPDGSQGIDPQLYGSQVNITLGDKAEAALPGEYEPAYNEELGNIGDLVSGAVNPAAEARRNRGLDEINENSYTDIGEEAPSMTGFGESLSSNDGGSFSMNLDNFSMGNGLTGMEPFGDSFSLPADSGRTVEEEPFPERKSSGNKPVPLEGDFNPKDIALGIRTVLETDKKG